MNVFVDTSALVKLFHEEEGTEFMTELLMCPANVVWLLDLARLEFTSALYRRFRNKEVDERSLVQAMEGFEEELNRFHLEPMTHAVVDEAENLLRIYGKSAGLRTLDALHLGCFCLISEIEWRFVSADNTLCETVTQMGYKALNPLKADSFNREEEY